MIEQKEELNQKQIAALFYAVNEKNITPRAVFEELAPFIERYFYCDFQISDDNLTLKFLNGQTLIFSAKSA